MPYIKDEQRKLLKMGFPPGAAGDLNYMITVLCMDYFDNNGGRYQQINDVIGALECAKQEFYRRLVVPYEEGKIVENGDVF